MQKTRYFLSLLEKLTRIDLDSAHLQGQTRGSQDEISLGTLSVEMQKLWIVREETRVAKDDAKQAMEDLGMCHVEDHTIHGENIPQRLCEEFSRKMRLLQKKTSDLMLEFKTVDGLFWNSIKCDFPADPKNPVFGIRKGFEIIRRADNSRKDRDEDSDFENLHMEITLTAVHEGDRSGFGCN